MKSPHDTAREFHDSVHHTSIDPEPGEPLAEYRERKYAPLAALIAQDRAQAVREALEPITKACQKMASDTGVMGDMQACSAFNACAVLIATVADGLSVESERSDD